MAILKRLRKTSKQRQTKLATKSTLATTPSNTSTKPKTNFFDLPGEIRNDIYTLLATHTTLDLFPNPSNNKNSENRTPGLLLTTRLTRQEYTPILLSLAHIRAHITDFSFLPLQRVVGSLYATELKALRQNRHLVIVLHLKRCSGDAFANLRRWCVSRCSSLDRLGWGYVLAAGGVEERVFWKFVGVVRGLEGRIEGEGERWEVGRVREVLERGLGWGGADYERRK